MSSTGQVKVGQGGAEMDDPPASSPLTQAAPTTETSALPEGYHPPARPVVPPRAGLVRVPSSTSPTTSAPPATRPAPPKVAKGPPVEGPRKLPAPPGSFSGEASPLPGVKKARPPSVHSMRPLPSPSAPNQDANAQNTPANAETASSPSEASPLSSHPTMPT